MLSPSSESIQETAMHVFIITTFRVTSIPGSVCARRTS